MSTVVYLSNQQIQVVTGKRSSNRIIIENCYTENAPEGSIINGMIMDAELFIGFLKDFWAKYRLPEKNVTLVINSSKFAGKMIELPKLNVKKTHAYISREYADINRSENSLFGYLTLQEGKEKGALKKIYAESVNKDFIKEYLDIFEEIGVHPTCILSGESSLIGLVQMTLAKRYKTFSLLIAESNILTTVLWIDGSFYYYNNVRSFYEQGTEEYAQDVARSVSQLVQFMQAHQIEQKLESIFVAGIAHNNLQIYQDAVGQMQIDTPVELFASPALKTTGLTEVQKSLLPASGFAITEKNADFMKQYAAEKKNKADGKAAAGINFVPVFVTFGVVALIFLISLAVMLVKKAELRQIEDYNSSPEVVAGIAEYDMLKAQNSYLSAQYDSIKNIDENIKTYPLGDSQILDQIEGCAAGYASVAFDAFDAAEGTIQMTASSDSVDNINVFIGKLNQKDIFNKVDYTGYQYNETTGNWDIHVTCVLAQAAGR